MQIVQQTQGLDGNSRNYKSSRIKIVFILCFQTKKRRRCRLSCGIWPIWYHSPCYSIYPSISPNSDSPIWFLSHCFWVYRHSFVKTYENYALIFAGVYESGRISDRKVRLFWEVPSDWNHVQKALMIYNLKRYKLNLKQILIH